MLEQKNISSLFYLYRHEISIHQSLDHVNIAKLLGICPKPFCLIIEFLPCGTLREYLDDHPGQTMINWKINTRVATETAKALLYMHGLDPPVAHLDVKSANVLLCCQEVPENPMAPMIKLIDFGFSQRILSPLYNFSVDNPIWAAPEMILNKPVTEKADIYSFGIICWELATHDIPWHEIAFLSEIASKIKEGRRPVFPTSCPYEWQEITARCWAQKPEKRQNFGWILDKLENFKHSKQMESFL